MGKRFLSVLVPLVALIAAAACAPGAAPPTPKPPQATASPAAAAPSKAEATAPPAGKPKEPLKLKVATAHPGTPEAGLAAIAQAMGYFKQEGLDVEFVFTKGGGDTVQAVQVAGGADVGILAGAMSVLGAIEKGADLKIISAGTTPANQWWAAAKGSPYNSIKDLAGKSVGFTSQGSSSHMFLLGILEKEGVKAEPVAAGDLNTMWTQVKTGQLAAGMIQPPEAWLRVEQEGAKKLFATADYPEFAEYTYIVNFARTDSVRDKAEAIRAMFRGWKKAADLIIKDPAAATKAYMPNTELPEDLVLRYFKSIPPTKYRLAPIGGMDVSIKYAKFFKFITKDPDLNKVVDLSLVPQ